MDAEREVRRALGESGIWNVLTKNADQLTFDTDRVEAELGCLGSPLLESVTEVIEFAREVSSSLKHAFTALETGDFDLLRQESATDQSARLVAFSGLPSRLRARQHPTALYLTNTLADIRESLLLLARLSELPNRRSVFILAEAGSGKTQLSAQLTVATSTRPAGMLLRGKDLHAGQSLDDLAKRVVIQGVPVTSFESLLAAMDAACASDSRKATSRSSSMGSTRQKTRETGRITSRLHMRAFENIPMFSWCVPFAQHSRTKPYHKIRWNSRFQILGVTLWTRSDVILTTIGSIRQILSSQSNY